MKSNINTTEPLKKKRKHFESKQKGLHYLGQVVIWILNLYLYIYCFNHWRGNYAKLKQVKEKRRNIKRYYTNRKKGSTIPTPKDINTLIHLNKLNIKPDEVKEFYDFIEATNITLDDKINLEYKEALKEIEKLLVI